MATPRKFVAKAAALEKEPKALRHALEEAGTTLREAATATMNAAAKDTRKARTAVIAAAEEALAAAEKKLHDVRMQLRKQTHP